MQRILISAGAIAGFGAVGLAALMAHTLVLPEARMAMVRAGLQIEGWHAMALLATALWLPRGGRLAEAAGLCFLAGTLAFCGAVYGLGLGLWHVAGLAPVGGTLLLGGWALLAASGLGAKAR